MKPLLQNRHFCHGGKVEYYRHASGACQSEMRFSIFLPEKSEYEKLPVLYWLSGLTCSEDIFMIKAGAQKWASELGMILVAPDTSARNTGIAGATESWEFGEGAGFYVDATQAPWSKNFKMYTYTTEELPNLIEENFPALPGVRSISGHSMGGHGAIVCALNNPGMYRSVSAFSPIAAPMQSEWGQKIFTHFLGPESATWRRYDSSELIREAKTMQPILVDIGTKDQFLENQLKPALLEQVARERDYPLKLNYRENYDHSYYFVSTFIESHLRYHAESLDHG